MPSRSTTCISVRLGLLVASLALAACGEEQKIDAVERRRVPASLETIRSECVRTVAELGVQKRLRAVSDLEADLRWQFSWLEDVREMRKSFEELATWCQSNTDCSMGLKVLRPDLPPLSIPTTTNFLEGIGAAPMYVHAAASVKWLEGPAHKVMDTSKGAVERVLKVVDRANELSAAELRHLITGARALQGALRDAAGIAREGAARAAILGRIASKVAGDMSHAADKMDPFWQVGAARIAQASLDLGRYGRRAAQSSRALEEMAAQLVEDGRTVGQLADTVTKLLYP